MMTIEIKIGDKFDLISDDPFPRKASTPSVILDIKDGWVRYYINEVFCDERMEKNRFLSVYRKIT